MQDDKTSNCLQIFDSCKFKVQCALASGEGNTSHLQSKASVLSHYSVTMKMTVFWDDA